MLGTQRRANALTWASQGLLLVSPTPASEPTDFPGVAPLPLSPFLPEIWIKNHGSKVSALPEFTPPTQQNRSRRLGVPPEAWGALQLQEPEFPDSGHVCLDLWCLLSPHNFNRHQDYTFQTLLPVKPDSRDLGLASPLKGTIGSRSQTLDQVRNQGTYR